MTKIETERVSKLLDFIESIAEDVCDYGDNCPGKSNNNKYCCSKDHQCLSCQARRVIKMDLLYLKEFIRS